MFRKNINLTLPHILMEYAKVIKGRFKAHQREEGLRIVVDLWNSNVGKVKGLKGFVLMTDSDDSQGATNTTVWESKQEMDTYYTNDKNYLETLEKIRPMMDGELERDEYIVFKYNMK
jgi:quinol monooxygenase YgiN